jgi:urease accessory protein
MTVNLGNQTRCFLSTQASTKVYRNQHSRPCSHRLRAQLDGGSVLVSAPDPVQAFKGSHYHQQQVFSLAPESGLVLVDWLCSGRAACGERWAFDRFQSRIEVFLNGSRVLVDSLLLDPADGPLVDSRRMGRFDCLALVLVIGSPLRADSARLLEEFSRLPVPRHAPLVSSASPIVQGVLIRLAGESVEAVGMEIRRLLAFVPQLLQDSPWSRKW